MLKRATLLFAVHLIVLAPMWATSCGPAPAPCSLFNYTKVIFVGTVTEDKEDSLTRKFLVTEAIKGVRNGDYIDVHKVVPDVHFEIGEQYLVFAKPCWWMARASRCLTVAPAPCSDTRPLKYAAAVLEQLRAEKSGRRVAAVYGTLELTSGEVWEEGYPHPLPNILIRLQSGRKSFETKTDEYGVYAFGRLPPGRYQVSADLLPNAVLAGPGGVVPVPSFELPRRTCFENDLLALPTGRITSKVIGPDGKPLYWAVLVLYPASQYKQGKAAPHAILGKSDPSGEEFNHLPAGDYLLIFNSANMEDPNAPFPMTFYPSATTLKAAQLIHLSDGQQILNADIHVSNPLPTRQITIRLAWGSRKPQKYIPPQLIVHASRGKDPWPAKIGPDTYTLNLLLNARYTIHAQTYCNTGTTGKAETAEVAIDSSDLSVSEVTLKFDTGECMLK